VIKILIASVAALAVGFVVGTRWVAGDVEDARTVGAAAKLLREDKILSLLESKDLEAAVRAQTEFVRLTLIEVQAQHRSWPPEVQAALQRRQALQK
jgi:hypothetical protein